MALKGTCVISGLELRRRAVFNIAFNDGVTELSINDDDNAQALDPATGRSVDSGGCSMTLYKNGEKVGETLQGQLSYSAAWPYKDIVALMPGKFRAEQVGTPQPHTDGQGNLWYWLEFTALEIG